MGQKDVDHEEEPCEAAETAVKAASSSCPATGKATGSAGSAADSSSAVERGTARSWLVVAMTLLTSGLFPGMIFGWASLQVLLEKDGVYSGLCGANSDATVTCDARTSRLILIYTIGTTVAVFGGVPGGIVVTLQGPLRSSVYSGIGIATGLLLLGISDEDTFDAFPVGTLLLGLSSSLAICNSIPVAFVVPKRYQPMVMTGVNCLFDASAVSTLGLYWLYTYGGLSRKAIFIGAAVLALTLFLLQALAWRGEVAERLRSQQAAEEEAARKRASSGMQQHQGKQATWLQARVYMLEEERPRLHGLPFCQQLKSFEFIFIAIFFASNLFRSNAYMGTNKELLVSLGDAEQDYFYTQLYSLLMPASMVFAPLISFCLRRYGFGVSFLIVCGFGTVYNVVALLPSLPLQVLAFAAFTNFRAFFYSAYFTYLAHTFGSRTSTNMHGVLTIVASILNFLTWPFVALTHGDMVYLYATLLVLTTPSCFLTLQLWRRLQAADAAVADCREARERPDLLASALHHWDCEDKRLLQAAVFQSWRRCRQTLKPEQQLGSGGEVALTIADGDDRTPLDGPRPGGKARPAAGETVMAI
eukprot:TRINITY_DN5816_c0_g1_i1.p1 TRINITY_DN5816_c0_g1~~TRINITY_DN5816_c0_g1_i1.p1  ORF type:complete len:586 (+),score=136.65 TRINITY_DN5816_c0_g1_i1:158-1915(+)